MNIRTARAVTTRLAAAAFGVAIVAGLAVGTSETASASASSPVIASNQATTAVPAQPCDKNPWC